MILPLASAAAAFRSPNAKKTEKRGRALLLRIAKKKKNNNNNNKLNE